MKDSPSFTGYVWTMQSQGEKNAENTGPMNLGTKAEGLSCQQIMSFIPLYSNFKF